jgi:hypothetical protein
MPGKNRDCQMREVDLRNRSPHGGSQEIVQPHPKNKNAANGFLLAAFSAI